MTVSNSDSQPPIIVFTDGSGARPDGKGSAIAWLRKDTGEKYVERINDLTNNDAEYRAVFAALESLPNGVAVELRSDSQLVCCQFSGKWKVSHPAIDEHLVLIRTLIREKQLRVVINWIPRTENLAGKLL